MAIKFFNDPSKLWNLTELLLQGAGVTLSIFFLTLLFAVPLGVLFAQARMSKHAVLRAPTSLYIYLMRSTPLMLQIMFVYFLLPQILPFKVDRFSAVIFAFAVNYAAYLRKFSVLASSPSLRDSTKPPKCWAIPKPRRFSASSCRRWSNECCCP